MMGEGGGTGLYVIQNPPAETAMLENGSEVTPLVTLKNGQGGVSHIIMDDHCFVLAGGSEGGRIRMVSHWYREAAWALHDHLRRHGSR